MDDKLVDLLYSKPNEELINILSSRRNECSEEVIELIKNILKEREVDVNNIPKTTLYDRVNAGDKLVSKLNLQGYAYTILAITLLIISESFNHNYIFHKILVLSKIILVLIAISKFKKKKKIKKIIDSSTNYEHSYLNVILRLNDYIKNKKEEEISAIIKENISPTNYAKFSKEYEAVCYITLEAALVQGAKQYDKIKKRLQPLIDLNILEEKYPHKNISKT